jgi:hypothetical protein
MGLPGGAQEVGAGHRESGRRAEAAAAGAAGRRAASAAGGGEAAGSELAQRRGWGGAVLEKQLAFLGRQVPPRVREKRGAVYFQITGDAAADRIGAQGKRSAGLLAFFDR